MPNQSGRIDRRRLSDEGRLTGLLGSHHKVDSAINSPDSAEPKSVERLLGTHAWYAERSDDVEQHAPQIGDEAKARNEDVLDRIVGVVFMANHPGHDAI